MATPVFDVLLDQGRAGLNRHASGIRHIVILDTFCFGTPIDLALNRGAVVFAPPNSGVGAKSQDLAPQLFDALEALRFGERFDLAPSYAGALSMAAYDALQKIDGVDDKTVISACLRNAAAVCEWILGRPGRVLLLGATSHLNTATLPYEDLLVAGAIAAGLSGEKSPAVHNAHATFVAAINAGLYARLSETELAKQFLAQGQERNLRAAAELDVSSCVPVFDEFGAFASF